MIFHCFEPLLCELLHLRFLCRCIRLGSKLQTQRGIGLEIVRELRGEGCKVVSWSRSEGVDLMPEGAPERFCEALKGSAPDIIVHVLGGSQGLTDTLLPSSDWAKVWRLNLGIAHDINRVFIPMMQRNKWGRIIHISSHAAAGAVGYCPYATAKAALNGYVRSVAKEFSKDGIILCAVSPGVIHTPGRYFASLNSRQQEEYFNQYLPIHRFGRAEEVARAVVFLASQHSSYMAGSILTIDGGAR